MATLLSDQIRSSSEAVRRDHLAKQRPFWEQRWLWGAGAIALILALYGWLGRPKPDAIGSTFVARRGPLQISVLEGGSIEARESQEIRSEVKGPQGTKILSIVEEGYLVTEEDVKNGKILVELDSSEIKDRIVTHDIQFQSTIASLIEAQQAYDIQLNQNKSDLKLAEQKVRFARMDLEKYLGDKVATEILSQLHLEDGKTSGPSRRGKGTPGLSIQPMLSSTQLVAALTVNTGAVAGAESPLTTRTNAGPDSILPPPMTLDFFALETEALDLHSLTNTVVIDFSKYAKAELLGDGSAQQSLRKLEDDLLVAQSELKMAETKFAGSERLRLKDFLTKTEYENDKLTVEKATLKGKTAKTALDLFIKYEFTKSAEEFLSKYDEALRALERAWKEAVSKLAQSHARLRSAEGRYRIEEARQKELYEQLSRCVIRAQKSGLVVYGGGGDRRFYYGEEQIREGATVRERQPIITIPDMTQMAVRVKIHEAQIKKIQKGMAARIQIDAFADLRLSGEVSKVAVLPDSQDRWMNPDMKVYLTTIEIDGAHEWLKPGMSAKVEILVDQLDDAVYVPIQAVVPSAGKHLCYVVNGSEPEVREIEIGQFNDEFIEIKKGLKEGERVLLRAPEGAEPENEANGNASETPPADQPIQKRNNKDSKLPGAKPPKE
ncbi:MAG: HlyD family efflux transporter periplasmic adaptor subunit, partial [Verrucomicrobia bacterium]|nr:HlyD family efflux transporter periplasmic adaptor subunit [Verrucomicrobiota bacterium]